MSDEDTMSHNHAWGGAIFFPEQSWKEWYDYWILNTEGKRFYRYVINQVNQEFVGEVAKEILIQLPEWFGLPDSTNEYIQNSKNMPFW